MDTADIDWAEGVPLTAGPFFMGLYQPSPETREFWEGVKVRELRLRHCPDCERDWHPKRIVCTNCGSDKLEWRASAGTGEVYCYSEVHRTPAEIFSASAPYIVGIVRLDEGVYLFSRLMCKSGEMSIGMRVRADFRKLETGRLLPVFLSGDS
jgi:uncharacterized OB-fold protein